MENKEQRGPNPTSKTVNLLIARAGGRCQFKNCNRNIFLDKFTLTGANNSNVAHIVASSPNGPRGNERSLELSDKIENLMLMCKEHHHIIDHNEKEYTVEILQAMKCAQEEKVRKALDYLHAEETTIIYFTSPIKGKFDVAFSRIEAAKAVLPKMKPDNEFGLSIGVEAKGEYTSPEYWSYASTWLENGYDCTVRAKLKLCPDAHFSVFPIAPIPLIIKLGYYMGDKIRADVYQKKRHPDTWKWETEELTNCFEILKIENETGSGIAVVVSITAEINLDAISKAGSFKTIFILRSKIQSVDSIKSQEDLSAFWHKYQELLELIAHKYEDKIIHVFPAVPVSVAFEMGRRYMPGVYPKMLLYDRDEAFFETIKIGD